LVERFGSQRVFDVPTSENALTGIGLGLSLGGNPVLMTHQRADFFLLALIN
jgi:pyruvate/2-oxoglutarate/acetoin dehydrogenase E1 component